MLPQRFNLDELGPGQKIFYISVGSLLAEILSAPLERAKIILQTKEVFFTKSLFYNKELQITLEDIKKTEGTTRLWYGLRSGIDRQVFFNFGKIYGYYAAMDNLFMNPSHVYGHLEVFFSTLIGTTIGTLLTQPPEVARIKLQAERVNVDPQKYDSIKNKMMDMYKSHGKSQGIFFTGLKTNLLLQNTHAVIEVFTFFQALNLIRRANLFDSNNSLSILSILGANTISTLLTAPLDYLHTRHVHRGLQKYQTDMVKYAMDTFKNEVKHKELNNYKGIAPFYKGFLPYFFKTSVANCVFAFVFQFALDREEMRRKHTAIIINEIEGRRELEMSKYRE